MNASGTWHCEGTKFPFLFAITYSPSAEKNDFLLDNAD